MHVEKQSKRDKLFLEIMLIVITVGVSVLYYMVGSNRLVVLNLFYLPVVLSGFFLGRYISGALALFSFLVASIVTFIAGGADPSPAAPVIVGLIVTVWGAVLGLTAILVGSLSDDRETKMKELHEAYVGVVEVLSRYLHGANPVLKDRTDRIAQLSERMAAELKLSPKQVDDIRVASMLQDMGNIEITSRVIRRAVGALEDQSEDESAPHTFQGVDLVESLSSVLRGAVPLLLGQDEMIPADVVADDDRDDSRMPIGAQIIRAAREYDQAVSGGLGRSARQPEEALQELREEDDAAIYSPDVLSAIEKAIARRG
jgi:hypothetical protein